MILDPCIRAIVELRKVLHDAVYIAAGRCTAAVEIVRLVRSPVDRVAQRVGARVWLAVTHLCPAEDE
jgi:hypothetical protein